jgi:hypothetical protein
MQTRTSHDGMAMKRTAEGWAAEGMLAARWLCTRPRLANGSGPGLRLGKAYLAANLTVLGRE